MARGAADTVRVAPPTGETEADRASILAALEEVEPGGTVLFAPGTYMVGRFIEVPIPRVTLAGHPDGTMLRGCEPAAFEDRDAAVAGCNGFVLTGGRQTVRQLTFEHTWHALAIGCGPRGCRAGTPPLASRPGGYLVEKNVFRETQNGIRVLGQWSEPAVIRENRFVNAYHAVQINGRTAHVVDNHISVPEPGRVPTTRHPGTAVTIGGWAAFGVPRCDSNVIEENRITGHPNALLILAFPESACRENVIRGNTIEGARVGFPSSSTAIHVRDEADSTIASSPVVLLRADPEAMGLPPGTAGGGSEGVIEDNLIEGNRISGASGLAIEVVGASGNRLVDNTISGVVRRDPFPGNTLFAEPPRWREANGSGIWLSPGSDGNEIVDNTFEEVAAAAVFLEGDGNRVEVRSASDEVRDLGRGNRVMVPDGRAAYRNWIEAAMKRLVTFERSAHVPFIEEPGRFVVALVEHVLPLAGGSGGGRTFALRRGHAALAGEGRRMGGMAPLRCATGGCIRAPGGGPEPGWIP